MISSSNIYPIKASYRKPLELALDKKEQFNHRVRAINAIGLSGDPRALGMLAIISNRIENPGLRDWSDYWLADMQKEFGIREGDMGTFVKYAACADRTDPSYAHVLSVLLGNREINRDYDAEKVTVESSLPRQRFNSQRTSGTQELPDGSAIFGPNLAKDLSDRLLTGRYRTVDGVFGTEHRDGSSLESILNVCRGAREDGLTGFACKVAIGLLQRDFGFTHDEVKHLNDKDRELLDNYGFIKDK